MKHSKFKIGDILFDPRTDDLMVVELVDLHSVDQEEVDYSEVFMIADDGVGKAMMFQQEVECLYTKVGEI